MGYQRAHGITEVDIASFPIDTAAYDAFGRLRVSNPTTIFDSKSLWDKSPLFWDDKEVSGSGATSFFNPGKASVTLKVSTTTAGKRVRQTFQRFNYQPGKSQLIFLTVVLDLYGGGTDIIREVGIFDDNNGIFLKDDEGTYKIVQRSSTSGSAVDTEVSQSSWSIDSMDGTGPSGITLDFTKTQIIVIDYEWLGVGRVRFGFVAGGIIYHAHCFNNANSIVTVYMATPNLPIRYSAENLGTANQAALISICSTVISEGGLNKLGILRHKDSGTLTGLATGTTYAVVGIRLKSTHIDAGILLENISLLATTNNDQAHWEIYLNPTIAGTFTYSDMTNSAIQAATGAAANTVTGGTEFDGGFFETSAPATTITPNAIRLGAAIDNTVDEFVLTVTPITNNIGIRGSITWRELS